MDPRLRDGLLAWSLVNLLFFRRWAQIMPGGHDYFLEGPRPPGEYLSLMLLVALLGALAWGVLALARRAKQTWPRRVVQSVFVVLAAIAAYGVLVEGWVLLGRPDVALWIPLVAIGAAIAGMAWLQRTHKGWHRRVLPIAVTAMMLFAPLVPIMYVQGFYHAVATDAAADRFFPDDVAPQGNGSAEGRVVWIVLDEMDQRLTFEDRPEAYPLPQLERLRAESLYATQAYAPNAATLRSIPSMTTGRIVEEARPHAIDGLQIRFDGSDETLEWRSSDTVFHDVRDAGGNVGIVGTYHPYCRIFAAQVTSCTFEGHYAAPDISFWDHTRAHLFGLTRALPTGHVQQLFWDQSGFKEGVSVARQEREIDKFQALAPAAVNAAADPGFDLVYLHLNAPHPTGMRGAGRGYFDAASGDFRTGPDSSYFDNLVLADRTIGQIRDAMEATGVWENSTVIVTADHGYRPGIWGESQSTEPFGDLLLTPTDHRVVFLVKPPGPPQNGTQYDEPFNLVLLRPLVGAAFAGALATPEATATWLDAHRTFGPAPFYKVR